MGNPTFFESVNPQKYDPTSKSWAVAVPAPALVEAAAENASNGEIQRDQSGSDEEGIYQRWVQYYQGCLEGVDIDESGDEGKLEEARKNSVISDLTKVDTEIQEDDLPLIHRKRRLLKSFRQLWMSSSSPSLSSISKCNFGRRITSRIPRHQKNGRHHDHSKKLLTLSPSSVICCHRHQENTKKVNKRSSRWLEFQDDHSELDCVRPFGRAPNSIGKQDQSPSSEKNSNDHIPDNQEYHYDQNHMREYSSDEEKEVYDDFEYATEDTTSLEVAQWDPKQGVEYIPYK